MQSFLPPYRQSALPRSGDSAQKTWRRYTTAKISTEWANWTHPHFPIKRRRLTQVAAAALMGIDQPKVSALLNGRLANFSSERLMRLLIALGQDVEIVIKAKPRGRAQGRLRVVAAAQA